MAEEMTAALLRHWELKLLALGFSIALWFFVMTSEKTDIIFTAPVEFEGIASGLVLTGERPESVDVQLHGLRGTLARLGPDQVKARVSMPGVGAGETAVRVSPEQIVVPVGVTVLRVNPSKIRVVLSRSASPQDPRSGPRT
jgi:hypothetical protein